MSAVLGALVRGSISNSFVFVTNKGNVTVPQVGYIMVSNTELYIVLADQTSNSYTVSEVQYYANGSLVFSLPVNVTKQSNGTLVIAVKVTVISEPWESNLVEDILYAMIGYIFRWTSRLMYRFIQHPSKPVTTCSSGTCNTTHVCVTSEVSSITTRTTAQSSYTTATTPTVFFGVSRGSCSQIVPLAVYISDTHQQVSTTQVSMSPTSTCPYSYTCSTTVVLYFTM